MLELGQINDFVAPISIVPQCYLIRTVLLVSMYSASIFLFALASYQHMIMSLID
jgi:hypothetical protein